MTVPYVVIVIPCSSMNEYVKECLKACSELDYDNFHIALLPDERCDPVPEIRAGLISVEPTGDVSISAKRNIAISRYPEADIYALIDSDAYPARDWLANAMAAFRRSGAWAVGGPNISPPGESPGCRAVGNAARSVMVSGNMAFAKNRSDSRYCPNLHSCNLLLSRKVTAEAGVFNEDLLTGEDRDLCHRIISKGGSIYFDRDVVVYHHNRRLGLHYWGQRFVHGYSIFSIAGTDRSWANLPLFLPPVAAALFVAAAAAGFFNSLYWVFCGVCLAGYLAAAVVEAGRHSSALSELPATLAAILISGAGYIAGSIVGLLRTGIDFKRLYNNYPGRDEAVNWKLIRYIDQYAGIPLLQILRPFRKLIAGSQETDKEGTRRILVVKFWGIGNLFMMLPALNALRHKFPQSRIDLLTLSTNLQAASTLGIFGRIHEIDTSSSAGFIRSFFRALRNVRQGGYDLVIDFEQFARFSAFFCAVSGIPRSRGYCTRGQYRHYLYTEPVPYDNNIHVTLSYAALAGAEGWVLNKDQRSVTAPVRSNDILQEIGSDRKIVVVLHVGTSGNFAERRWPAACFAGLADMLSERYDLSVVLTGLEDEVAIVEEVLACLRHKDNVINMAGRLDFAKFFSLISACDLVVSADTSAVHIASASDTPVIGLYGPNTPLLYGPWGQRSGYFYKSFPCSPCITNFNAKIHVCRHPAGRGACMAGISSQEVFDAACRYLSSVEDA